MKNLFGEKENPEVQAREAMRHKKWSKALDYFLKKLQETERDFALWNLVGDLHMNKHSRAQAVDAWRRALEGYALEGLYENVLGIARKILRRTPEEEDVHLLLAEAYLGLEYHADCLASFRSYLKLSRHRSESDMRSLFKKILDQPMGHAHLLEELDALYKESGIEDIELERRLAAYVSAGREAADQHRHEVSHDDNDWQRPDSDPEDMNAADPEDLITLGGMESFPEDTGMEMIGYTPATNLDVPPARTESHYEPTPDEEPQEMASGAGKDHYDLGMVYKEMTLWDAAIAEFEQARQDKSIRMRATLALSECLQESRDLQGALELLEREAHNGEGSSIEQLSVIHQMGNLHELLGNVDEALRYFRQVQAQNPAYGDVETRINQLQGRVDGVD